MVHKAPFLHLLKHINVSQTSISSIIPDFRGTIETNTLASIVGVALSRVKSLSVVITDTIDGTYAQVLSSKNADITVTSGLNQQPTPVDIVVRGTELTVDKITEWCAQWSTPAAVIFQTVSSTHNYDEILIEAVNVLDVTECIIATHGTNKIYTVVGTPPR